MLENIIDPHLVGTINPGSLKKLSETAMQNEPDENSTNHIADIPLRCPEPEPFGTSVIGRGVGGSDNDLEDATTSAVFSQLVNPWGR